MKRKEFEEKYCQDILRSAKKKEELMPEIEFTFDVYKIEEDGEKVKAILVGDTMVTLSDILTLSDRDFNLEYQDPECFEARQRYLENFVIMEGEEVLEMVRRQLRRSMDEIDKYASMNIDDLISG